MFTYEVACVVELIFNINTTALPKWTVFSSSQNYITHEPSNLNCVTRLYSKAVPFAERSVSCFVQYRRFSFNM